MNYNDFIEIINNDNFNENIYNELVEKYGYKLISKFFSKYMNTKNLDEESYDKCKYFLEDDMNRIMQEQLDATYICSVQQYLDEITKYDLLEEEEEKSILIKLDVLKKKLSEYENNYDIKKLIKFYGDNLNNINSLKNKEIQILKKYLDIEKEFEKLSNRLMECNLRLVISVAKHYRNQGLDFLDLIQEGNIGLKTAINKFDISKGNRFSTYAMWWIRQNIIRQLYMNCRTIKIPINIHELLYRIKKANNLYEKYYNKVATNQELIEFINAKVLDGTLKYSKSYEKLTPEILDDLKKISQNVISMSTKIGEKEDDVLELFIPDLEQSVDEQVEKKLICDDIKKMFEEIKPRYKLIIMLRFGFSLKNYMDFNEFLMCFKEFNYDESYYKNIYIKLCKNQRIYTLEEIANIYSITRERIRQMEVRALRSLKSVNSFKKILSADSLTLYK